MSTNPNVTWAKAVTLPDAIQSTCDLSHKSFQNISAHPHPLNWKIHVRTPSQDTNDTSTSWQNTTALTEPDPIPQPTIFLAQTYRLGSTIVALPAVRVSNQEQEGVKNVWKKFKNRYIPPPNQIWITTKRHMEKFLAEVLDPVLKDLKPGDLQFFCDMEGNNLGRDGTISLLQITIRSLNKTWIFDVTVLKEVVFGTNSPAGNSIRRVLECQEVQTAWFDCRGDGNALMFKAQVRMQNVFDMSLLELTVRQNDFYKEYRWGLDKSIGRLPKSVISFEEYAEWHKIKNAGKSLCRQHGYQLFDKRPLVDVLKAYAGQDTIYMPHIYDMYMKRLEKSDFTYQQILDESRNAIDLACSESFNPNDRNNSKAPYPFRVYRDTYADYY